jgi:hypothetical protein
VERALKRTEQLLSDAIETIPEGFSLYDKADRLVMFNSKYRTLLYPDQDVEIAAGMTFEAIVRQAAASGDVGVECHCATIGGLALADPDPFPLAALLDVRLALVPTKGETFPDPVVDPAVSRPDGPPASRRCWRSPAP